MNCGPHAEAAGLRLVIRGCFMPTHWGSKKGKYNDIYIYYYIYYYIYIYIFVCMLVIPKDYPTNYPPEWAGQISGSNFNTTALEENRPLHWPQER